MIFLPADRLSYARFARNCDRRWSHAFPLSIVIDRNSLGIRSAPLFPSLIGVARARARAYVLRRSRDLAVRSDRAPSHTIVTLLSIDSLRAIAISGHSHFKISLPSQLEFVSRSLTTMISHDPPLRFSPVILYPPRFARVAPFHPRCCQQVIPREFERSNSHTTHDPRCRVAVSRAARRYAPPHGVVIVA